MDGITHHRIMLTKLIPMAILKASSQSICFERITVSSAMLVNTPHTIATDIIINAEVLGE